MPDDHDPVKRRAPWSPVPPGATGGGWLALSDDDLNMLEVMLTIHIGQPQLSLTTLRETARRILAPGQNHLRGVYRFALLNV